MRARGCYRCGGTGVYSWGACINGRMTHSGPCFRCVGGGQYPTARRKSSALTPDQDARNATARAVAAGEHVSEYGRVVGWGR